MSRKDSPTGSRLVPSIPLPPVSRRTVLKLGTALTGLSIYTGVSPARVRAALRSVLAADEVPSLVASVMRADDMLSLRFLCFNLKLLKAGEPGAGNTSIARLVRVGANQAAFIAVEFEPQNIAEEAFFESAAQQATLLPPPIKARVAARSRLAFRVPNATTSIPFTLDDLLNWDLFEPSIVPVATSKGVVPQAKTIRQPNNNETAIEVPWRLVLSPHAYSQWDHSDGPVTHANRTELWHTRLETDALRVSQAGQFQGPSPTRTVRAVWTQSFNKNSPPDANSLQPFPMSLRAHHRWQIVRLTSDFGSGFTPQPIDVDLLMLSSLGAWTNMLGNWNPPDGGAFDIEQFNHRSTMGRDQYTRVVLAGYLFPFGHAASMTEITERKVRTIGSGSQAGKVGAYLHKRLFITVKEPERKFTSRDMPFKSVRITTIKTPDLNNPFTDGPSQIKKSNSNQNFGDKAFWPRVGDDDFLFTIVATDWDGQQSEFTAPLPFVSKTVEQDFALSRVRADYLNGPSARRKRPMHGQKIALAASTAGKPGDTTLEVNAIEWEGWIDFSKNPNFIPKLRTADVRLQAVEQVKSGDLDPPTVEYHPVYLQNGFTDSNSAAQLFIRIKNPVALDFGKGSNADRSGGIATPNMSIGGLSRKTGPVGGDLSSPAPPPKFDPKKFFEGASILGGISLAEIINAGSLTGFDQAPKITNRPVYPGNDSTKVPEKIETLMSWALSGNQLTFDPLHIFVPSASSKFALNATFTTPVDPPGTPTYEIVGDLTNFTINMIGESDAFLILHFNRVNFTARQGEKPDVDVDIGEVEFAGILSFVNELKDFLSTGGNGLSIDITPTQVAASYTLGLPTISVGIFSLQNISLSAGVVIPFTGKPFQAFFAFCKREAQFLLTYTIFGGGGYFQLTVGESPSTGELGVQLLEVGLEFGANASLDIGVASGSVELMAGIYFAIGSDPDCDPPDVAQLTGYVRLGGELEVLGIITLSLEFNMSLTYDFTDDSVFGQATLVVEVEVLFFSADVELSVEKKFGGSEGQGAPCAPGESKRALGTGFIAAQANGVGSGPVTFADLISETDWEDEYVPAFATAAFS